MDARLLTQPDFWRDSAALAAGAFPGTLPAFPELDGHVLFETSGSTGEPKWIALSKAALLASAAAVNRHLGVDATSCWGLALPLHHVGGFGVAARAFEAGCRLETFGRRWDAAAFADWAAAAQVTHTSLVPAQAHDLVAARIQAPGCLRAIVVGGGHLDLATGRAARDLGWPVLASYGMTEAASQVATQPPGAPYQPASIPVLPVWRTELSAGGCLRIAGPALFSGSLLGQGGEWIYQKRPGGWHQTRDLVELNGGRITPLGRADTLVKVLGELVDPTAIERELADLSGNRLPPGSFVVAAVPDARAGHALVPVFEASADSAAAEAALRAYAERAPGFRRLRPPVWLEHLPRSPLGKPLRREITERIGRGLSDR